MRYRLRTLLIALALSLLTLTGCLHEVNGGAGIGGSVAPGEEEAENIIIFIPPEFRLHSPAAADQ
jgi:hypothetical protein